MNGFVGLIAVFRSFLQLRIRGIDRCKKSEVVKKIIENCGALNNYY